jgi:hypothetical protein
MFEELAPCPKALGEGDQRGRPIAADWIRHAAFSCLMAYSPSGQVYHDMATHNIVDGTEGFGDGSACASSFDDSLPTCYSKHIH